MDANTFRIDTSGNTELRDYLARKKAGEECELTFTVQITDITADGMTGKITAVELPGDDETEPETIEPTGQEPVSATITGTPAKYAEMPA